jgi:isoleucyl-tRNA synthetase
MFFIVRQKNSLRRRSVRTVLDIIFQRLVTWFAPLLAFTMEEVWLERYPGEKSSVHLIDIPKTPKSWKNEQLQKRWTIIRLAKRVVTGAIEIERQNKVIGSSLEAAPTIYTTNQEFYDCLTSIDFKEICITSSLEIRIGNIPRSSFSLPEVEEFGVTFEKAKGNKCHRCWRYEMPKNNQSNQELCDRCAQVIESC